VGSIGSGNPYVYANNVPTTATDPSGRDVASCVFTLITGAIATILGVGSAIFQGVAVVGAETSLEALVTEGASDLAVQGAELAVVGATGLFWFLLVGAVVAALSLLVGSIIFCRSQ